MSEKKESKVKTPVEMTTKEAMRKLFPPPVVEEAKNKALEGRRKAKRA